MDADWYGEIAWQPMKSQQHGTKTGFRHMGIGWQAGDDSAGFSCRTEIGRCSPANSGLITLDKNVEGSVMDLFWAVSSRLAFVVLAISAILSAQTRAAPNAPT
jgi:hypothetical protein